MYFWTFLSSSEKATEFSLIFSPHTHSHNTHSHTHKTRTLEKYMKQLFQAISRQHRTKMPGKGINEMSYAIILAFCPEAVFKFHCREGKIKQSPVVLLNWDDRGGILRTIRQPEMMELSIIENRGMEGKNYRNRKRGPSESLSAYRSRHTWEKF